MRKIKLLVGGGILLMFLSTLSASFVDDLVVLNETECYNTGNCEYRFIFASQYYYFTPDIMHLYDIVINVKDPENTWHNYWKTVYDCYSEGKCTAVHEEYVDFHWNHSLDGQQYIAVEIFGNGESAYDHLYHDVQADPCYGYTCGNGTCVVDDGMPVCECDYGYVNRGGTCVAGWFEDENLAYEVISLLNSKGFDVSEETDIVPSIMFQGIEALSFSGKNIVKLGGIELFTDLQSLDLSDNEIVDLGPLSDMQSLSYLNISLNPVSDVEPLSGLYLSELDISNTKVFDYNPLKTIISLEAVVFSGDNYSPYAKVKPENIDTGVWIPEWFGGDCVYIQVPDPVIGGKVGKPKPTDCGYGGVCISGICVCDEDYERVNGKCVKKAPSCDTGYVQYGNRCIPETSEYKCALEKYQVLVEEATTVWDSNSLKYDAPSGKTTAPCHFEDTTCNNNSICLWDCAYGFAHDENQGICVEYAYREIYSETYNQLVRPGITRNDVALEQLPGVPSFYPTLSVRHRSFQYNDSQIRQIKFPVLSEWFFDLPRVELGSKNMFSKNSGFFQLGWADDTITIFMPWGAEEYSTVISSKCYYSGNPNQEIPCEGSQEDDWYVLKLLPSPGQNVYAHVVLRTRKDAIKGSGSRLYYSGLDNWIITRFGDDGSVANFERSHPRPYNFNVMDYIPISEYENRDGKKVTYSYVWNEIEISQFNQVTYSHIALKQATIIDPVGRVIRIVNPDNNCHAGLMGKPDSSKLYKSLSDGVKIEVYRGKLSEGGNIVSERKVVSYDFMSGFDMDTKIFKDGAIYSTDKYRKSGNIMTLVRNAPPSYGPPEIQWEIIYHETEGYMSYVRPIGFEERRKTHDEQSGEKWIVKKVKAPYFYYSFGETLVDKNGTPYSYRFFNPEQSGFPRTTVFSEIDGTLSEGEETKIRKTVEEFSAWMQLKKYEVCDIDNQGNCTGEVSSEEIKYNVNGAPVYNKNIDGQVSMNLFYGYDEVFGHNYNIHYKSAGNEGIFSMRKTGRPKCSAVYSIDSSRNFDSIYFEYVMNGAVNNSDFCQNAGDRKATEYKWIQEDLTKPWDLEYISYPNGITEHFKYDYQLSSGNMPEGYIPSGKIWGKKVLGRTEQNDVETCFYYNNNYKLIGQGTGVPGNCEFRKGFLFDEADTGEVMIEDFSIDKYAGCDVFCVDYILPNNYIHDDYGRKIVEKNAAGVSTIFVYDDLDRVVFSFMGCNVPQNLFPDHESSNAHYVPYNFTGSDNAGEGGTGVSFSTSSGQFPYSSYANLSQCQYYRKYKYDRTSNLTHTYFFEYAGLSSNNAIVINTQSPKRILQETKYDLLGRPYSSCQYNMDTPTNQKCIETERDIFGNIVKKIENGVTREVEYDYLNNPLKVKIDGVTFGEYSYSDGRVTELSNKYGNNVKTQFGYDAWGRTNDTVDPFGNVVQKKYDSTTDFPKFSKSYNGTMLTGFTGYQHDDLGRVKRVEKAVFDPEKNSGNSGIESINSITSPEVILAKDYEYDSGTGVVKKVEDNFGRSTENFYDYLNRIIKTDRRDADGVLVSRIRIGYDSSGRVEKRQSWSKDKTVFSEYFYDTFGREVANCLYTVDVNENTDCINSGCTLNNGRCSAKMYNTGGQVIWSADTEMGQASTINPFTLLAIVGNETVYEYNAFGDVVKTARRMTSDGLGGGSIEPGNYYETQGWVTTTYEYYDNGKLKSVADDRGAVTYYNYSHKNLLESVVYCGKDDVSCASPRTVTYEYDNKNDLKKETFSQNNQSVSVNYERDPLGRTVKKYTGTGALDLYQEFEYDDRNFLKIAQSVNPSDTESVISIVERKYDSMGNVNKEIINGKSVASEMNWTSATKTLWEETTLPDGKKVRQTNINGRVDNLKYDGATLLKYNYNPVAGNVLEKISKNVDENGSTIELNYFYNEWRRISQRLELFTDPQVEERIAEYEYTYSLGQRLIGKENLVEDRREAYQYDSYYRLRRVDYDCDWNANDPTCVAGRSNPFVCGTNEDGCDDFQLDGVHNIIDSNEDNINYGWEVDGFNRLVRKFWGSDEITYAYDFNNNMVEENRDIGGIAETVAYVYDKMNRLIGYFDDDYAVSYSYDPFNRRVKKVVTYTEGEGESAEDFERIHKYVYNGWNVVSEEIKTEKISATPAVVTSWKLNRYIDHGMDNHVIMDMLSCNDDGNGNCQPAESTLERYWFHKDERGNVVALSDGEGSIIERYRYTVYGEHIVLDNNFAIKTTEAISPFLWGGSMHEPETDLYWMRNRYYHKGMKRFINQDPIGIWGDANNLGNGFAYVAGMVIEGIDPTGLWKQQNPSIDLSKLEKKIADLEDIIDAAWRDITGEENSWVSSTYGGKHAKNSLHYSNFAVDIAVRENHSGPHIPMHLRVQFAKFARAMIRKFYGNNNYRIIVEDPSIKGFHNIGDNVWIGQGGPCVHFEYNPKIPDNYKPSDKKDPQQKEKDPQQKEEKKEEAKTEDVELVEKEIEITVYYTEEEVNDDGEVVIHVKSRKERIKFYQLARREHSVGQPIPGEDDPLDKIQALLVNSILQKMLRMGERNNDPIIKDDSMGPNSRSVFVRNPYYLNNDPVKSILMDGSDGSGRPLFVRNPFAAPGGTLWRSTADYWFHSDFNRGEIGPSVFN